MPLPLHLHRLSRFRLFAILLLLLLPLSVEGHTGDPCETATSSGITLLEPIGSVQCFFGSASALTMFNAYLGTLLPWLLGLCATYCILMVTIGGVEIMISGGQEGLKESGKKRILHAIIGLVLLTFSATILNFLNASFFT